jgi:hypothetical protein
MGNDALDDSLSCRDPEVYYGGPYDNYWGRPPYACGVYGYC